MAENSFSLSSNKVLSLGIAVADTFAKPINNFPKWNTLDTFSEIKFSAGGCAVNTGINLKNLLYLFERDVAIKNLQAG